MRRIARNEILPIEDYETIRPHFRQRIIAEKQRRRVPVGEHISVVFENRDTVLCQIQEMLRTERITSEPAILHELETYNDLIPADLQLSMTLFVEIPERELRDRMLSELEGLEKSVALSINAEQFPAQGEAAGVLPGRTTAVHYLKFALSPAAAQAIRAQTANAAVVISHPKHLARSVLSKDTLGSLAQDLA